MTAGWVLLLPLERLRQAKSRLTGAWPDRRAGLARALGETVAGTAAQVGSIREIAVPAGVTCAPGRWTSPTTWTCR